MNRFAIALFIFLLTVSSLHSQGTASLVGTVTDQSGASVADAQVTVVNTATQFTRTVPTNANGEYVVSAIPTGAYVVTVGDVTEAAPLITRRLVAAGADVLSISPSQHSLEDVYLELIDEDAEAAQR